MQAFHDIILFGTLALASFSAGKVFTAYGWQAINMMFWPVTGVSLFLVLFLMLRNHRKAV